MKLANLYMTLFLLSMSGLAFAQPWPSKSVTLVVSYPPGGGADAVARSLSGPLGKALGTTVIVENKPGASGQIAAALVAKSTPDGYTLLLDASSFSVNPGLFKKLPYDAIRDFKVLGLLALFPNVLLVNPNFPAKSVKELVTMAKNKPEEIAYATSGNGSAQHMSGAMFEIKADIKMQGIPYKGGALALNDVIAGQVPVLFGTIASTKSYIETKKLTALAVTSKKRVNALPDIPTMAEAGVPAYEVYEWNAIFAPSGTPDAVVKKLSDAIATAMQTPEMKEKIPQLGGDIYQGTLAEGNQFIQNQIQEWTKIIREKNISLN
ncbi:MAG: tripartite tricarboxylate transporter substrate binding protein [Betaproteobacteria bacterium]